MRDWQTKHGMSKTSYYTAWRSMIQRCQNPEQPGYELYGGRGIRVCERWLDFNAFRADMGERPGPEYSLEREDNNGDYEPKNCRWATPVEQQRHKRRQKNNSSGVNGVHWNTRDGKWQATIGVNRKTILLGRFSDIEAAATARKNAEREFGFHPSHGES
jgi:hypothetical protein